jgi:hypothetical protein
VSALTLRGKSGSLRGQSPSSAAVSRPLAILARIQRRLGLAQSKTPLMRLRRRPDLTLGAPDPVDVLSPYCFAQTITALAPSQLAPLVPSMRKAAPPAQ